MRLAALLLAAAAMAPRAAAADCPAPPLVGDGTIQPGLGGANMPLDTQILVDYEGSSPVLATPQLGLVEKSTGASVDVTVAELPDPPPFHRVYVVTPAQPLAPSTQYELADGVQWRCTAEPCSTAPTAKWIFTTGTATDATPPLPPVAAISQQMADVCEDASCCGPYHALVTDLQNPASGAIRYDLYDGGALVASNIPFRIATECTQPGDVPYPGERSSVLLAEGHHHLTLAAYDQANNESMGTQALDLDLSCASVVPPSAGDGGGCSTTGGGGAGSVVVAGALASIIAKRRRRAG